MKTTAFDFIGYSRQSNTSVRWVLYPAALFLVMVLWLLNISDIVELYALRWREALTMVLGAFVAGSTPLGGGAVSFPIFTKVLASSSEDAKLFAILIQSVGMGCASLLLISLGRKIYWSDIAVGIGFSLAVSLAILMFVQLPPLLPSYMFLLFELIALLVILWQYRLKTRPVRTRVLPLLITCSVLGGVLVATLGTGADLMMFIYLVVGRRLKPAQAIPTTVVFMALNACLSSVASIAYAGVNDFVYTAWLAAVPVVAIFAPLGGWVVGIVNAKLVLSFMISLILLDVCSSIYFIAGNIQYALLPLLAVLLWLAIQMFSTYALSGFKLKFDR